MMGNIEDIEFDENDNDIYKKCDFKITNHAKHRYVERIMGYSNQQEIDRYIANDDETLQERIKKMCYYSKEIYNGTYKNYGEIKVLNINTWIIIVNESTKRVITMWECDLGFGKELNNEYIKVAINNLKRLNEELVVYKLKEKDKNEYYSKEIENLKKSLEYLEHEKSNIQTRINTLEQMIETNNVETRRLKREISNSLDNILMKKTI